MPKKTFDELRERLLRAGVAPRHVRRYVDELGDHLADLRLEGVSEPAALTRLGSAEHLAAAMIERRQFRSWCSRAPWAVFGVGPVLLLAFAYFVACLYLWLGWRVFEPGTETPFMPVQGWANLYFQAGKFFYTVAPVLIGWAMAMTAARQRLRAIWPAIALGLTAWMGATAQIHASRSGVPGGLGHIRMGYFVLASGLSLSSQLLSGLLVFSCGALPYLVWRLQRRRA